MRIILLSMILVLAAAVCNTHAADKHVRTGVRYNGTVMTLKDAAPAQQWKIIPKESHVAFEASQPGASPIKGGFSKLEGDIRFDPDNLAGSGVRITVHLASLASADENAQKELPGKPWLNMTEYPLAVFQSTDIRRVTEGKYQSHGILTLKGHSEPVVYDFTLREFTRPADGKKGKAVVEGTMMLRRTIFSIGEGEWADVSVVKDEVPVTVYISAAAGEVH